MEVKNMPVAEKTMEKITKFFAVTNMPKEQFCRKIGITSHALRYWQLGKLNLSAATLERIDNFLSKYDAILTDVE